MVVQGDKDLKAIGGCSFLSPQRSFLHKRSELKQQPSQQQQQHRSPYDGVKYVLGMITNEGMDLRCSVYTQ